MVRNKADETAVYRLILYLPASRSYRISWLQFLVSRGKQKGGLTYALFVPFVQYRMSLKNLQNRPKSQTQQIDTLIEKPQITKPNFREMKNSMLGNRIVNGFWAFSSQIVRYHMSLREILWYLVRFRVCQYQSLGVSFKTGV